MIISALVLVLSIFEMVYSKSKINSSLDEFGSNYGSLGSLASGYARMRWLSVLVHTCSSSRRWA